MSAVLIKLINISAASLKQRVGFKGINVRQVDRIMSKGHEKYTELPAYSFSTADKSETYRRLIKLLESEFRSRHESYFSKFLR